MRTQGLNVFHIMSAGNLNVNKNTSSPAQIISQVASAKETVLSASRNTDTLPPKKKIIG